MLISLFLVASNSFSVRVAPDEISTHRNAFAVALLIILWIALSFAIAVLPKSLPPLLNRLSKSLISFCRLFDKIVSFLFVSMID